MTSKLQNYTPLAFEIEKMTYVNEQKNSIKFSIKIFNAWSSATKQVIGQKIFKFINCLGI